MATPSDSLGRQLLVVLLVAAIGVAAAGVAYLGGEEAGANDGETPSAQDGLQDGRDDREAALTTDAGDERALESSGECPTARRYVNKYERGEPPEWLPEDEVDMEELQAQVYEVTRYPDCDPTASQIDAAWELYDETYETAKEQGWFEFEQGIEVGYRQSGGRHYVNVHRFLENGTLDPMEPEFLIYYDDPESDGKILAGVMYEDLHGPGEQVGGPTTLWHYHPIDCCVTPRSDAIIANRTEYESFDHAYREVVGGEGPVGRYITGEMLHVWFVRHPEGPFASTMAVSERYLDDNSKMNESGFKRFTREKYETYFRAR